MTRAMMHNKDADKNLWGETMNTTCHIVNKVYFKTGTKKTLYELWKGRKPNVKYFKIFGSTCFILKDRENVGKFDTRSNEGIFLGYSSSIKAYRVFNKRASKVVEIVNVVIDETSTSATKKEVDQLSKSTLPLAPESDKVEEDPFPSSTPCITQSFDSNSVEDTPVPTTPLCGHHDHLFPSLGRRKWGVCLSRVDRGGEKMESPPSLGLGTIYIAPLYGRTKSANVLYVEELRVNLLRISQIYDQDFMALFSKGKCLVLNELGEQFIGGIRTLDNCYSLVPNAEIVCNSIQMPNEDLWHQRMGHASYKQLTILSKKEVVLGILKLVKQAVLARR